MHKAGFFTTNEHEALNEYPKLLKALLMNTKNFCLKAKKAKLYLNHHKIPNRDGSIEY